MWKHLALVACCAAVLTVPSALADESQPSTTPTTTTPTPPPCDASCQLKRDYGKLRRATTRHPVPDYVVMCESGGILHRQQVGGPAGGRYQIEPRTWSSNLPSRRFIGIAQSAAEHFRKPGEDAGPRWSGRLLQDKVAANIRADQGLAPWSCA